MDPIEMLCQTRDATRYEPAGDEVMGVHGRVPAALADCISHVVSPHNRRMPVLKAMTTTVCERNCGYCGFRNGRDVHRVSFTPDALADGFYRLYQAGLVEGLFLSAGVVRDGVPTQDKIIATGEILRKRYHFRGYLHLKVMPGAEYDQVVRTIQLADRVSVNLEAPNAHRLSHIAPQKKFADELVQRLQWIERVRRECGGYGPSSTTQFVVGPAGESDLELLQTTQLLHQQMGLARAYFMAFNPVVDTPLEDREPTPLLRQHRLYQSSFLLRDYGFDVEELPFGPDGNLPLREDPKTTWARGQLQRQPVEINRAERAELLRVPGIGLRGADRIIRERRRGTLRQLEQLQKMGVRAEWAAPFVLLDGRRPLKQLGLW